MAKLIPFQGKDTKLDKAVSLVQDLARESGRAREKQIILDGKNIEKWWEFGARRWIGDHWDKAPDEGLLSFVLNRDQTAITSTVADQTRLPFRPRFAPVETVDAPVMFVSRQAIPPLMERKQQEMQVAMAAQEQGEQPPPGVLEGIDESQLKGVEELSPRQAMQVEALSEPFLDPFTGAESPPIIDHKAVVTINDAYRADKIQQAFNIKWMESGGDDIAKENEWYSNIFGHCPMWVQLNANWTFSLTNVHPMNCLVDPIKTRIEEFDYLLICEFVSSEKAKAIFPKYAAKIGEAESEGQLGASKQSDWRLGAVHLNTEFQRPMVKIVNAWIRDQPFPMEPDEAIRAGLVAPAIDIQTEEPMIDEEEEPVYQTEEGVLTSPGDKIWPKKLGVRYIKILDSVDEKLMDVESPYIDIPVGWNRNLPLPFNPYGMPESMRLKDVTDAINHIGEVIVNTLTYYKYPQEYWPQSLLEQARRAEMDPHVSPRSQIGIPDDDYREWFTRGGNRGFAAVPPELPHHMVELWLQFKSEHDLMAGNAGVRQGIPPGADTSGKAIQKLLEAAGGPISYKSSFTERMIERVARILADAMVQDMPATEWLRLSGELTPEAFEHVYDGINTLRYDIVCEVVSGRGATQDINREQAAEDFQLGLISKRTAREKREIADPNGEDRLISKELRQQSQQTQTGQPQ